MFFVYSNQLIKKAGKQISFSFIYYRLIYTYSLGKKCFFLK